METFYWTPSNDAECTRMAALFEERVVTKSDFVAFHIAIDEKSGKPNGLRGKPMQTFDPGCGGMIFVPRAED